MRALLILHILILITAGLHSRPASAQEEPRFSPPRPVVSDPADFDDPAEDDADFAGGADFPRQAPPPGGAIPANAGAPLPNAAAPPPPTADFLPASGGGGIAGGPGKLHFKVVQGVFWHKGMKRTVKHPPEEEGASPAPNSGDPNAGYAPPGGLPDQNFGLPPDMGAPPPDQGDPLDDGTQF